MIDHETSQETRV